MTSWKSFMEPPCSVIMTLIMFIKLQIIGVVGIVILQINRILASMKDKELQGKEEKSPIV